MSGRARRRRLSRRRALEIAHQGDGLIGRKLVGLKEYFQVKIGEALVVQTGRKLFADSLRRAARDFAQGLEDDLVRRVQERIARQQREAVCADAVSAGAGAHGAENLLLGNDHIFARGDFLHGFLARGHGSAGMCVKQAGGLQNPHTVARISARHYLPVLDQYREAPIPSKAPRGPAILSFHRVYRACLAADADESAAGWRSLIRFFLPLSEHLVRQYFSDVWPDPSDGAAALFARLWANGGERLRACAGQAEKEFLVFLRDELFRVGREQRGEREPLGMTHEQFCALLGEFPHVPREAVVMLAKGYRPEKFAIVLHMEDKTAEQLLQKVNQNLESTGLAVRLPANLDRLLANLEQQETTEDCVPLRTFMRIKDGLVPWSEKEAADRHLAGCLHCFQKSVTYQELNWFFLDYPPAEDRRVEPVAVKAGLASEAPKKKPSLLTRMFRVAGGPRSTA